jgi:D-apionolactonase
MNYLKQYADALPAGIIQTGSNKAEPAEISLKAGKLTMKFSNGALRYISSGKNELIRMIYAAVRDRDWLTIIPVISDEEFDIKSNSFHIKFTCRYVSGDIDFMAQFEIKCNHDDSIILCMEGKANKTFQKNRIGFCVLHPVESCAGKPCLITHTNGIVERSAFPDFIQSHQPFLDIRSMRWPASGGRCCLNFEGDIFETEDQRNWTDASFKTYSTPLSLPYPVTVSEGTVIRQRIEFRVENLHHDISSEDESVNITLYPGKFMKYPMIGIARTTRIKPLTDTELRILRSLRFDHYRVNVHLFEDDWQIAAGQAIVEAAGLAAKVEFALFFDSNFEVQIRDFMEWFNLKRPVTYCFLIFHRSYPATPGEIGDKVIPVIRKEAPWIKIGIGTNANFAELNRNRPAADEADLECFSIQPQEHASDNQTLVENLKAQEYVVKSAARFSEGRGIWISPVNIRRRFNANNTLIEEPFNGSGCTPPADARIMSLFGACWTAISLKYLCENEIAGVTFFETVGEKGLMQGENISRLPREFTSYRGMIFPVYFIFKYLQKYRSFWVIRSVSSQPLVADSFSLSDGKQVRIILTNFTRHPQCIRISGCKGMLRMRKLNTDNFAEAASNHNWAGDNNEKVSRSGEPLSLEPFSISFVDGWLKKIYNKK